METSNKPKTRRRFASSASALAMLCQSLRVQVPSSPPKKSSGKASGKDVTGLTAPRRKTTGTVPATLEGRALLAAGEPRDPQGDTEDAATLASRPGGYDATNVGGGAASTRNNRSSPKHRGCPSSSSSPSSSMSSPAAAAAAAVTGHRGDAPVGAELAAEGVREAADDEVDLSAFSVPRDHRPLSPSSSSRPYPPSGGSSPGHPRSSARPEGTSSARDGGIDLSAFSVPPPARGGRGPAAAVAVASGSAASRGDASSPSSVVGPSSGRLMSHPSFPRGTTQREGSHRQHGDESNHDPLDVSRHGSISEGSRSVSYDLSAFSVPLDTPRGGADAHALASAFDVDTGGASMPPGNVDLSAFSVPRSPTAVSRHAWESRPGSFTDKGGSRAPAEAGTPLRNPGEGSAPDLSAFSVPRHRPSVSNLSNFAAWVEGSAGVGNDGVGGGWGGPVGGTGVAGPGGDRLAGAMGGVDWARSPSGRGVVDHDGRNFPTVAGTVQLSKFKAAGKMGPLGTGGDSCTHPMPSSLLSQNSLCRTTEVTNMATVSVGRDKQCYSFSQSGAVTLTGPSAGAASEEIQATPRGDGSRITNAPADGSSGTMLTPPTRTASRSEPKDLQLASGKQGQGYAVLRSSSFPIATSPRGMPGPLTWAQMVARSQPLKAPKGARAVSTKPASAIPHGSTLVASVAPTLGGAATGSAHSGDGVDVPACIGSSPQCATSAGGDQGTRGQGHSARPRADASPAVPGITDSTPAAHQAGGQRDATAGSASYSWALRCASTGNGYAGAAVLAPAASFPEPTLGIPLPSLPGGAVATALLPAPGGVATEGGVAMAGRRSVPSGTWTSNDRASGSVVVASGKAKGPPLEAAAGVGGSTGAIPPSSSSSSPSSPPQPSSERSPVKRGSISPNQGQGQGQGQGQAKAKAGSGGQSASRRWSRMATVSGWASRHLSGTPGKQAAAVARGEAGGVSSSSSVPAVAGGVVPSAGSGGAGAGDKSVAVSNAVVSRGGGAGGENDDEDWGGRDSPVLAVAAPPRSLSTVAAAAKAASASLAAAREEWEARRMSAVSVNSASSLEALSQIVVSRRSFNAKSPVVRDAAAAGGGMGAGGKSDRGTMAAMLAAKRASVSDGERDAYGSDGDSDGEGGAFSWFCDAVGGGKEVEGGDYGEGGAMDGLDTGSSSMYTESSAGGSPSSGPREGGGSGRFFASDDDSEEEEGGKPAVEEGGPVSVVVSGGKPPAGLGGEWDRRKSAMRKKWKGAVGGVRLRASLSKYLMASLTPEDREGGLSPVIS
eukprot:jgi/Mesvir1/5173/Mv15310-RA.3